jgi:hypothetical protein
LKEAAGADERRQQKQKQKQKQKLALVQDMLAEAEADTSKMASVFDTIIAQLAGNDLSRQEALTTPRSTREGEDVCQGPPIRNLECLQHAVEVLM